MEQPEIVILSAVRTAIGTFGGALAKSTPCELGTLVAREAIARSGVALKDVGHVVFGNVIQTEPRDMYLSRVAAIESGLPDHVPAMNVNRLCGSGVQAAVSIVQAIERGDCNIALAGGAEVMSRAPHAMQTVRFGQKMGDASATDMMIGALTDPFGHGHMGVTAENVAQLHSIDRDAQDQFALESHARANRAIKEGHFNDQIVPVETKGPRGATTTFDTDEHVRPSAKLEDFSKLRPVFAKDGSVTAGNASGINDGAAALVFATKAAAEAQSAKPLATVIGYAHAAVDPKVMGIGPVPAVERLLSQLDMSVEDFDVIESNEAFASQACAVSKALGFPKERVNPNGGAIALGHPIGATGAILLTKTVHELQRTGGTFGLVTMCIGGGQGIAFAIRAT